MEASPSPQQSNVTSYGAITVAIITLEVFAGMWINAFIVGVLCIGWVKKKTLNSNEKILLLLGCSRFWYLCFSWMDVFLSIIFSYCLLIHPIFQLLQGSYSFFNCSNLWGSACLCSFYCIKIANFRNRFFIYLKVKIDRMVPWLLLGSVVLSLIIGILVYNTIDKAVGKNLNFTCQESLQKATIGIEEHFFPLYFFTGFLYTTSFIAVIFSAVLLLFSLWRHKHKMQTNSTSSLSMEAHIRAMKSIFSFFIMYSINFMFLILTLIYSLKHQNHVIFLGYLIQHAFPGVHSLILIFSNPKLEKALLRILSWVKCKFCMR
ncbi:taste receptor type 2 member 9-like [Motacilla alba alba]|uniref:taste receptor type 2 member 9-like n=1 Tax=Motacilla alba alba TaxID=1094192 RepID=UPI0018D595C8|nr:taste receptor type 2 member 9-like [Motacilla alba alba]XP_037988765.1 taste receptor type 2 member 9-like [Motacilla alba alba]